MAAEGALNLPPLERASRVAVPVQLVVGEKSPPGLHEVARLLAGAIPGAALLRLAGQDHLASAKALLPVLTGFLKSQPQAVTAD